MGTGMYLTSAIETGVDREISQHHEIEMMFENYLMQVGTTYHLSSQGWCALGWPRKA